MSETHTKTQKKVDEVEKIDEIETFFPAGGEVKLPTLNKTFPIKKFTWGKEAVLGKLLGSLLKDSNFGEFKNLTEQNVQQNPQIVVNAFLPLLESAPDTITKMVATILDKDINWVEDELSIEDIVEVLIPFFTGAFKRYQNLYDKVNLRFRKP
jgi:hypothetical protein